MLRELEHSMSRFWIFRATYARMDRCSNKQVVINEHSVHMKGIKILHGMVEACPGPSTAAAMAQVLPRAAVAGAQGGWAQSEVLTKTA